MRQRRRLSALAVSATLAFSALPLFAGAVAATDVATDEEFREAWGNPSETLITLTVNITLFCAEEVPDAPTRDSETAVVVDGAGFTLHNPCVGIHALEQNGIGLVTLRNLTLTGNPDSDDGLNTAGPAVVEGSTITGHGDDAVDTDGDATVTNSSLSDNGDSGLEHDDDLGVATVSGSTLSGNDGDGIDADGDVSVTSSTISVNEDDGIVGDGLVTLTSSTVNENGEDGINAGADVTVSASTISGNGDGGGNCDNGIDAGGAVSVTGPSTISDNDDVGILADGAISVTGSTVSGNGVFNECGGEGIRSIDGDVTVTDSTVSDNHFGSDGVRAGGDATVTRSTISDNGDDCGNGVSGTDVEVVDSTITGSCTGIDAVTATVTNSTIMDNGTGVFGSESVTATHVTITDNIVNISNDQLETIHLFGTVLIDAEVNCQGEVDDQGFNFVDDQSCGTIAPNAANPQLGALGNNGGPTFTRLPAAGSPLLDAIPDADCEETTEQRGLNLRPQGAGCDIGSVEVFVPLPAASIADAPDVVEGNTGTTIEASFTVTLSKPWTRTVTVGYATANGSATAPADYVLETGTVTFAPGDVSEAITVTVVGDPLDEPNETFVVNLSAPVGATLDDAQGTGTILDDDGPAAVSINDVTVTEGNSGFVDATFTVRLLPASSSTVTVVYATANGTATAPADYESGTGTVTFAAGDTEETITIRVAGDTIAEGTETFVVNLTTPTGGAIISDSQGTGTIVDNEGTLGSTLPNTATGGEGLGAWGAPGVAIGLVLVSASAVTRNRRRQSVRTL